VLTSRITAAVAALNRDPVLRAWLERNTWGESPETGWHHGGCLVFAEALVEQGRGRLRLLGLGYELELQDPDEGSYVHVVAFDVATDRYLDAGGESSRDALIAGYRLKPEFRKVWGRTVIEPFERVKGRSIPYSTEIAVRAATLLRRAGWNP
jgi:hypothetical protein